MLARCRALHRYRFFGLILAISAVLCRRYLTDWQENVIMKLGLALTETAFSAQPTIDLNRVLLAESLEYLLWRPIDIEKTPVLLGTERVVRLALPGLVESLEEENGRVRVSRPFV